MSRIVFLFALASTLAGPVSAADRPVVVCTLADLGAIATAVAGDDAEVEWLCPGDQDPHFLPAKPSLARKVGRADLLVYNGLELEVGWLPVLIDKARNPRLRPGSPGDLDCSQAVTTVLEIPRGPVSRAEGDVHALGNPHYTLDPRNGARVARLIGERLAAIDPAAAARYRERAAQFVARIEARLPAWEAAAAAARQRPVVTYHKQWEYLADWLGLTILGCVEHRSGIAPSPRHVDELVAQAAAAGVKEVLAAPWNHQDIARKAAERMSARLLVLPPAVGADPAAGDYFALFDELTRRLGEGAQ
jgi:zinc/manganese transport system substrate-binding protein